MIALNGHNLSIPEVWQVAALQVPCELAADARPLIHRSRELVESLAAQPRAIYGINTGLGPLSGFRVSNEDLAQHQINLLHHLTVGQGALFSDAETRAIMITRANALARGYSGIREELIELIIAAVNRGVLPEIPSEGSVGASGDLVPLAHMAGLLVGFGHARVNGERLPATEALKKVGLAPVVLQCKEGLALVNGTSVMTGLAALAAHFAEAQDVGEHRPLFRRESAGNIGRGQRLGQFGADRAGAFQAEHAAQLVDPVLAAAFCLGRRFGRTGRLRRAR